MSKRDWAADSRICAQATSDSWSATGDKWGDWVVYSPELRGFHNNGGEIAKLDYGRDADAKFIAEAREGWPAALAEIERLQRGITRLRDRLICDLDAVKSADTTERSAAYEDCLESTLRRIDRYIPLEVNANATQESGAETEAAEN